MTESDIHFVASIALSFVAGFAAAIRLAVLLDRGAKEIKRTDETEHP